MRFLSKIAYFLIIAGILTCISATLNQSSNHSIHIANHGQIPLLSVSMNVDPKNYIARLIKSIDIPVQRLLVQIGTTVFNMSLLLLKSSSFYNCLGNKDHKVVRKIVKSVKEAMSENSLYVTSVEFNLLDFNPGSAKGFNFGLRTMMRCGFPFIDWLLLIFQPLYNTYYRSSGVDAVDWVLIVNNDISFYPGVLRQISRGVHKAMSSAHTHTPHSSSSKGKSITRQLFGTKERNSFGVGFTSLCW